MDPNTIVLDFQCFKSNLNNFIIKEISAISVESGILRFHHIVCPPYNQKLLSPEKLRECYWLTKHYHGLEWNNGDVPYDIVLEKITDLSTDPITLLVKGHEKMKFIKSIVPDYFTVLDMDLLGCQSLDTLNSLFTNDTLRCAHHKNTSTRCSLSNAVNLRKWYLLSQRDGHL